MHSILAIDNNNKEKKDKPEEFRSKEVAPQFVCVISVAFHSVCLTYSIGLCLICASFLFQLVQCGIGVLCWLLQILGNMVKRVCVKVVMLS